MDLAELRRPASMTYYSHHLESTRWNRLKIRKSDIVISTAYKAGTTWTQSIICNLLFQDEAKFPAPVSRLSPWVDMRLPPIESLEEIEKQTHRRFMKTHLPAAGLPLYHDVRYIVVCRDPRDVFFSLYHHWSNFSDPVLKEFNKGGDFERLPHPPREPINEAFREWLTRSYFEWESDGWPFWSTFYHAKTWWELRDWPNVMFLHFNDLKTDLPKEMRRIADFCGIDVAPDVLAKLANNVTFENMKKNVAIYLDDDFAYIFKGGRETFINKGTNGRWQGVLTAEDLKLYDEVKSKYSAELIEWLEHGGTVPKK